ncbi:MAG: DUF3501 family protein [Rhodospirillales bacterium]|nr:DUF3501 family protein [Rhodospirillales bacterium]
MTATLTSEDIMAPADYARVRQAERHRMIALKRHRRISIGPVATAYFENFDTIRHQVHEMVHIERGGPEQVHEEIWAYGSLVPNGRELVATLMVEIDDPVRRRRGLGRLGGFEDTVWIEVGGHTVRAVPETDLDRTTADGKASSVQFLHFPFPGEVITAFSAAGARVTIGIGHGEYQHMAVMPEAMRAALSADFTPDP